MVLDNRGFIRPETKIRPNFFAFDKFTLQQSCQQIWVYVGDFEKKIPASACRKKKIGCSRNVIESLWEKKGKKYPAHQIVRKKNLDDQKSPTPPLKS